MKKILTAFLASAALSVFAGTFVLSGATDKRPIDYKPGEPMVFTVRLLEDGVPVSGPMLKWTRVGDDGVKEEGEAPADASKPLVIQTKSAKPGFVRVTVKAYDSNGKEIKNKGRQKCLFDGGAGVDVFTLKGYPEPTGYAKDGKTVVVDEKASPDAKSPFFDSFWKSQKARLAKVPMKVSLKKHKSARPGIVLYEFSITSVGTKPATGWLCYPENAKPGSLPAVVNTIGYGMGNITPNYNAGKNSLAMTISRHGVPMAQPPEFHKKLKNEIGGFCFKNNNDPEKTYYNEMLLRGLRALEYLKTRPEWNRKDLKTSGGSMGAYQAIALAALDPDVTACNGFIPWCADLAGVRYMKRMSGWRPGYTPVLGLYDIANFAKRLKCPTTITINLGDYVCPPSGQFVMFNNMTCDKVINFANNGGHGSQHQPNQKAYHVHIPAKK